LNIVIDSNILFSALIKDSLTRRIILDYDKTFLFPEFIFEEIQKHKEELLKK
jgi:predicted nucleic acid-binding protein